MKINNNINIRNSFMDRKIKINDISIVHKSNSQSNPTDDGVILKLSQRTKVEDLRDGEELSEMGHNNILKVWQYEDELLSALKSGDGYANKMTNLVEKYYSMLNELKEKYSDTNEFEYYKKYLDTAFDNQVDKFAMGVAAAIMPPYMKKINGYMSGGHTYNSNLNAMKTEYANLIQNDVVNMFKNLKNYYDINKSFDGLTNSIASKNNSVMTYNDLEYMYEYNKKSEINDKLNSAYEIISQGGKFEDIEDIYNDIDNIINNMDCSDSFKDIYRQLLMELRKN